MWARVALAGASCLLLAGLAPPAVSAAQCPSEAAGGAPVGWIKVDDVRVPIKPVSYPAGGELAPPKSNKVVGVSTRHRPLLALSGTTVLTWHVRYGPGCYGSLNPLLDKPVGSTFTIVKKDGAAQDYRIVSEKTVPVGKYKAEWFRTDGPAQVSLFTCNDYRNGKFRKTTAIIAVPVST